MSIADRMAIMEHGAIRQMGAPSEIYDRPASDYVARLLGSPAMNILPIEAGAGGLRRDRSRGARAACGVERRHPSRRSQTGTLERGSTGQPARVFEVEPLAATRW